MLCYDKPSPQARDFLNHCNQTHPDFYASMSRYWGCDIHTHAPAQDSLVKRLCITK